METIPTTEQDPNSIKSEGSSPRQDGGRGSPPPNCAICLGTCRNKSFTDSCLHQFCFKCLLTWSKVKAECPLCKQNFRSIIHNVRSNHQYEEYMVEQRETEDINDRIDLDSIVSATRRFRYRTTLTLPRRESMAIQRLLLRYPMVLPARAAPMPPRRRRSPAAFRRTVYRYNLWARPLPDFTGRFRDCTPEFYRYNESQTTRLVPWLNRELQYLLNENVGHISYVISQILVLLPQYHINSTEFRSTMQRYFGERTDHFLHELYCFASTPYDMTGYDRHVQYTTDSRVSTMVNEVLSSSDSEASVDSDIVMISSSEPFDPPPGPSRALASVPQPVYPRHYIPDPTPAPAAAPAPAASNVIPIETISQSDSDDDSSEVMVVGYIKPPQDRTPEVVDLLGSDSDVVVQDAAPSPTPQPASSPSPTPQPGPALSPPSPSYERNIRLTHESRAAAALVMLTLRSHDARNNHLRPSRSDSDSAYTPSPPNSARATPRPRFRRPRTSTATNSTSTSISTTSTSATSTASTSNNSSKSRSSSCSENSDGDTSDEAPAPRKRRRVARGKAAPRRRRRVANNVDRSRKRKRTVSTDAAAEQAQGAGPSAQRPPRPPRRESKRLRSVVSVINTRTRTRTRSRSHRRASRSDHSDHSDWEDDLPLNLTLAAASSTKLSH